jgi:glycosyltransferase involved in cell wall biosynthesis
MNPLAEPPAVSVVVATRDRPDRLAALLVALAGQTLEAGRFEVVVVDEGSRPRTRALLDAAAAGGGVALSVLRHERPLGPGAARNAGWRAARGGLVAFTDDDCRPARGWLAAGLEAHRRSPGALVQGRTLPDPRDGRHRGPFTRTVQVERLGPQYETCNVFYPGELLERLGGFDEGFGLRPGGEDTDLAWRAIELGRRPVFCKGALVFHAVTDLGPLGCLRDATRWTETVRVFARHPATRSMLHHRIFWNVWHYLLVRSVLALALPRPLRPLRWAIVARHAMALRDRARTLHAGPALLPFLLAYDLIETLAVARGAARHRTLVL